MATLIQQKNKEDKISKIIDRVLKQVFGEEATQLIYKYLESRYSLRRDEISEKIDLFARGLEEFLSTGAHVIEKRILEDIYSSYGLLRKIEMERTYAEYDFANQIRFLMRKA